MRIPQKMRLCALLALPTFAPAFTTPRAALAADSTLTGIQIPRNGAPYQTNNARFAALLADLAKQDIVKKTPAGNDAEVFIWEGENYREDRVKFTRSGFQGALEAAGYSVKEIDRNELGGLNIFNHYDDEASFRPALTSEPVFFQAVNESKAKALVGTWIQSNDSLALGLLPVVFKAAPKPQALPRAGAGILVKNINDTGASLPRRALPKFPPLARKPRMVRGWLKDGGGRPVVGGEVAVHVSAGGGFRTTHKARSNAQGLYEVLLPAGVAEVVQVDTNLNYNGQKYTLRLDPVGGEAKNFNATVGHVEHYVLRPQQGDAGGTIYVRGGLEEGVAEITLTPIGPLLDGSAGSTLIYRFPTNPMRHETYLNGMPLGRYKLTARLLAEGEALPLRVQNAFGYGKDTTLKSSLQIDFEPGYTYSQYNPGKSNSGVKYFPVTLEP